VSEKPSLANFVATVPVTDESPVNSCEIRVAGSLSNLQAAPVATSVIVPKPNPMRTAMVDQPIAPISAVTMPPTQAAANTTAQPPVATPPADQKKGSGGFLSGIFGN
jgi:hypothetical protein